MRQIIVKDLSQFLINKKNKTIKIIMTILEKNISKIIEKNIVTECPNCKNPINPINKYNFNRNIKEWSEIRNTILDGINDFYADICLALENTVEDDN